MSDDPVEIQEWLRRLKWSLAAIAPFERDDIVEETRAHLRETMAKGATPSAALAGFGRPEDYARRFVDDMEVSGALGSQSTGAMLSVVGRRIHRSVVAAFTGGTILILSMFAFAALVMLAYKLSDPVHAGLWRNAHQFFIGKIDNPASATDLLGNWLYPLAAATLALAWLIGRFILLWAVRSLARDR
jgi:hypothetical protein